MEVTKEKIYHNIFLILTTLFIWALVGTSPYFYINPTPWLLTLLVLNEIIFGKWKDFSTIFKDKNNLAVFICCAVFFLSSLYGFIISPKHNNAEDLVQKLPFLFFPIIFLKQKDSITSKEYDFFTYFFVFSCVCNFILLFFHAFFTAENRFLLSNYSYVNLSWFHHPSYLSAMNLLAVFMLIDKYLVKTFSKKIMFGLCLIIAFLLLSIIMLASRATLLATLIVFFFYFIYQIIWQKKTLKRFFTLLIIPLISFFILLFFIPKNLIRISYSDNIQYINTDIHTLKESNSNHVYSDARMQTWQVYSLLAKEYFPKGYGTIGLRDKAASVAITKGYENMHLKKYNAHNQFLQSIAGMGIFGILALLLLISKPIYDGFSKKIPFFVAFSLIFIINFCFESILERQVGVMTYSFFYCFLQLKNSKVHLNEINDSKK